MSFAIKFFLLSIHPRYRKIYFVTVFIDSLHNLAGLSHAFTEGSMALAEVKVIEQLG